MDNIYVTNYLVNRQLERRSGKLIALFIDLKATFDIVKRGILVETMRERGIREELIKRVKSILREARSRVRIGKEMGENF